MIPIFLQDYKFIYELQKWMAAGTEKEGRHWTVSPFGKKTIRCELTWRFGENQIGAVSQCGLSAEEAVWRVLQQFGQWHREYYK